MLMVGLAGEIGLGAGKAAQEALSLRAALLCVALWHRAVKCYVRGNLRVRINPVTA